MARLPWTLADVPSQAGKRFLITGANSGVGYYAAVELARRGAVVLLACRDRTKGEAALGRLRTEAAGVRSAAEAAELVLLDLASLDSVQQVAEQQLASALPLDGLIDNAGVMAPLQRLETRDGFELQFGTNVLGHFALTCRLMPLIRSRVVTVSSIAHLQGSIDFDDLQSRRSYNPVRAYRQSKLADVMFAFELERRLRARGSGAASAQVASIGVHPGVARTNLFRIGNSKGLARVAEIVVRETIGLFLGSGLDGALPAIFAATATEAEGGAYYGPQGFREMRGGDVGPAIVAKAARDAAAQRRLWEVCVELTGVDLAG